MGEGGVDSCTWPHFYADQNLLWTQKESKLPRNPMISFLIHVTYLYSATTSPESDGVEGKGLAVWRLIALPFLPSFLLSKPKVESGGGAARWEIKAVCEFPGASPLFF